MWPIALPKTKAVHLLRLAWATVVDSINQSKTSQGNAAIQSGCKSQWYRAYWLRIQSESNANTSKGWERIAAVSSVSVAYPKQPRQKDGCESTAVQVYRLGNQSESKANTSKGWKRIDCGIKRIGCVSKGNPRCVVETHTTDRQTLF
jgi:hypothetical protein